MKNNKLFKILLVFILGGAQMAWAAGALEGDIEKQPLNMTAIMMFCVFVFSTLGITYWAAKRTKSRQDFYTAGGGISAAQNGIAISGDFLSAATFLGMTSAIYFSGYDGMLLAVGVMACWPLILFLIAERLRNLGRYTFIDVVSFRLARKPIRIISAMGSLSVVVFYLIGQMVGAGKLIELLFGLDYLYAVIMVNILMICYVSFGGMLATTWVQIIKAVLLIMGGSFIGIGVLVYFDFNLESMFRTAVDVHPMGMEVVAPGGWLKDPISVISVALTMLFGFMGLPHILMRFFTVKNAREARKSVFYATAIMGYFYILILFIGFGAIGIIYNNPEYHDAAGAMIGGKNMLALHVAHYMGGDIMLGFMSAVTFATILAVVSGLTLAAAATIAHDLFAKTFCEGTLTSQQEIRISRYSIFGIGVLGILLGIAFEHQNVVFVVTIAMAVAASVNFPILILSMYWKKLTTRGAVIGGTTGLVVSLTLIMLSPSVMVGAMGFDKPIFPYLYPTLFSMPIAFFVSWIFSVTDNSEQAKREIAAFDAQYVRSETGIGISDAADH